MTVVTLQELRNTLGCLPLLWLLYNLPSLRTARRSSKSTNGIMLPRLPTDSSKAFLLRQDHNLASTLQSAPPHPPLKVTPYPCWLTGPTPLTLAFFLFLCFVKLVPILGTLRKTFLLFERLFPQIFAWLAPPHPSSSSLNVVFLEITQSKVATRPLRYSSCFNYLHMPFRNLVFSSLWICLISPPTRRISISLFVY